MSEIMIDRNKLAKYLQKNAELIAHNVDIDIDTEEIKSYAGVSSFLTTVRLHVEDIPLDEVESK